jgi:leader peptidase (prepilin peptidase)/N-methyltransferase
MLARQVQCVITAQAASGPGQGSVGVTLGDIAVIVAAPFVGSFIGLAVQRRGTGASILFGRSRCDSCGHRLGPLDLIPLASWLASRGRCRYCGARIGLFAPAMELAALAIAVSAVAAGPGWLGWLGTGLGWTLLALAVIDLREMVLPDPLTLPLIAAGLAVAALAFPRPLDHLIGAAIGGAGFAALGWAWHWATGREALGLGDAKLFAAAGAWLGWQGLPSVLLIASAAGLAAVLVRALFGAGGLRAPLPFGPALAAGFWLTWVLGPIQIA